jgi:hypothetical protein
MDATTEQTPAPASGEPPQQPARRTRVAPVVFGTLSMLLALVLLAAGGLGVWALTRNKEDGYYTTKVHRLATPTFALATSSLDIGAPGWLVNGLGSVRIRAIAPRPVFLGIGKAADVNAYLARVPHTEITDFNSDPFRVTSHVVRGTARPAPPARQGFWRAHASGAGTQTVTWDVESGKWSAVAMNAAGTRNVLIAFTVGAKVPSLVWITIGALVFGLALMALGGWLFYRGVRAPATG